MIRFLIFLNISFQTLNFCKAQEVDTLHNQDWKLNSRYFKGIFHDAGAFVTSPYGWKSADWVRVAVISTTSVGLYLGVDQNLKNWSQNHKTHTTEQIAFPLEKMGLGQTPLILYTSFFLYGSLNHNIKACRVALLGVEAFAFCGLSVSLSKYLTGRMRPRAGGNYDDWIGPQFNDKRYNSFFSGHTITAFSMATVLAMEFKEYQVVPVAVYTLATLVGLSRIHDNAHWASDVIVGAAMGHYITKFIVKQHPEKNKNIAFYPSVSPYGSASFIFHFGF